MKGSFFEVAGLDEQFSTVPSVLAESYLTRSESVKDIWLGEDRIMPDRHDFDDPLLAKWFCLDVPSIHLDLRVL